MKQDCVYIIQIQYLNIVAWSAWRKGFLVHAESSLWASGFTDTLKGKIDLPFAGRRPEWLSEFSPLRRLLALSESIL